MVVVNITLHFQSVGLVSGPLSNFWLMCWISFVFNLPVPTQLDAFHKLRLEGTVGIILSDLMQRGLTVLYRVSVYSLFLTCCGPVIVRLGNREHKAYLSSSLYSPAFNIQSLNPILCGFLLECSPPSSCLSAKVLFRKVGNLSSFLNFTKMLGFKYFVSCLHPLTGSSATLSLGVCIQEFYCRLLYCMMACYTSRNPNTLSVSG